MPKKPATPTLKSFKPDPANANRGTQRGRKLLDDSIQQVGFGRSIVVDRHGTILAGNKTHAEALELGHEQVIVVPTEGEALVVVQRNDLDLNEPDGRARLLAYLDNRAGELGLEWDADQILRDVQAGYDLSGMFSERDLAALFADLELDAQPDTFGPDEAEALLAAWQVEPGQLWRIPSAHGGEHRLLCGDSTYSADVTRLMNGQRAQCVLTDPPYGVSYERGQFDGTPRKSHRPQRIQGDDRRGAAQQAFIADVFNTAREQAALPNATIYMCSAALAEGCSSYFGLVEAGVHVQSQIIWRKNHFALGRSDYQWSHEGIWYGYWQGKDRIWNGGRDESTVIDAIKPAATVHPNEKPIDLFSAFIRNSTLRGGVIYEPFSGGGTTLLAAEALERTVCAMELEPKYVALTLARLAALGLRPQVDG